MTPELAALATEPLDPVLETEIERFEDGVTRYLAGEIDDDVFRVFRLNQGIYGQRQGGHNQMVRIKVPHGRLEPEQLEMLGPRRRRVLARLGAPHDPPERADALRAARADARGAAPARVRSASRAARRAATPCATSPAATSPARARTRCSTSAPWAQATTDWFLRNPLAQRLPRKFKINFSGCATDCGQAMFNDVGVIAVSRPLPDGTVEPGFRVFVAGGLGANPHPAQAIEEFTPREQLLADHRVDPAGVQQPRQPRQQAARPHEVARRHHGHGRAARAHLQGAPASSSRRPRTRRASRPLVEERGDAPAGMGGSTDAADGDTVPVNFLSFDPFNSWEHANVVRGRANGTVSAYAHSRLGDITSDQLAVDGADPARLRRRGAGHEPPEPRAPGPARRPARATSTPAWPRSTWPRRAPSSPATSSSCPGADTCNLAVTQSRGLAADIGRALEEAGLAEVPGVRINISGCTNSCGQHHISDIGFCRPRAPRARSLGARLPDAARRPRRRHGDRVRREGHEAAGQARVRSRRAGRAPLRRRARRRRDVRDLARPLRRRGRGRRRPQGARRVPDARRGPRLLRRLRRDRARTKRSSATASARHEPGRGSLRRRTRPAAPRRSVDRRSRASPRPRRSSGRRRVR